MKTFKQYLTEKTFKLGKDVDMIYDKLFRKLLNDYKKGKGFPLKQISPIPSSALKSKDARKAHELNPITIFGGIDEKIINSYAPSKSFIHLTLHTDAIGLLRDNDFDMKRTLENLPKSQHSNFKAEFDGSRVKATIYHELSHWISDSVHNRHILKTLSRAKEAPDIIQRKYIIKQGQESVALTDYEIDAQIHGIKQLKRLNLDMWDLYNFSDLLPIAPNLTTIYKNLSTEGKKKWLKKIRVRMARENLLGKEMKKF